MPVPFEITHCSILTNNVNIITPLTEYIYDYNKNTGFTPLQPNFVSNLIASTFRVTDGACPIWKFDVYNKNGKPNEDSDDVEFGRVRFDGQHDYYMENPWETFAASYYPNF